VFWALLTRTDPQKDFYILPGSWSTSLDPMVSPTRREQNNFTNSRVVIDATRPYHWDEFAPVNEISSEVAQATLAEWGDLFSDELVEKYRAA
jgi:3-polyprenyl-4-hydroxybenzoate decarboxylase